MASSSSSPPSVEVEGIPEGMDEGVVGVEEGPLVLELEPMGCPESAAAKKKRKKKEREREKKAAAAAASTSREVEDDKENKDAKREKKVPRHVREMQEALARRKEAEERAEQERAERMRKEEEEQRRQDELLRIAEEARMRKKEREKEKILKKKEAGLPVTAKQKEKQARIETFRNQILADSGVKLPSRSSSDDGAATKRPVYSTKKKGSKVNHEVNNGIDAQNAGDEEEEEVEEEDVLVEAVTAEEVESVAESSGSAAASALSRPSAEEVPQVCIVNLGETSGASDISIQKVGAEGEDAEEWDAKRWDQDTSLALAVKMAAFDDEDDDSLGRLSLESEVLRAPLRVLHGTSLPPPSAADARKAISSQLATGVKHSGSGAAMDGEVKLRSPICCIMGHVDAGKTKLLDCIRGTNIQEGEAGGITQQIGATYLPAENIRERTSSLKADAKLNVPGLLVIDTPGHASFTNLRSRGSGLCDIAVLVVDIKRGLERQTIESLDLLKNRNTEFIVALNKVDRLYGWKRYRNTPFAKSLKQQAKDVKNEFNEQLTKIITQFKEQGVNTELYSKNKEMGEIFSIVPTSAVSGDGIPELLLLVAQRAQKTMVEKLTFSNKVQCTVLEVKVIEGHGTTIDVVLVNGVLCKGDRIVCCGMQGPIVTTIRALLTPHPMKELRVKGTYMHHREVRAAQGIKITAQGLEHAIGGSGLYVVRPYDDLEEIKEMSRKEMNSVLNRIDKKGEGVFVQASTLGSLEALLDMLEQPDTKILVGGISLGPVNKKDVVRASTMVDKKREYAAILAFDVKVAPEARKYADDIGVKIFKADVIYHLFDQFKAYVDQLNEEKKRETAVDAVVPCVLEILPECVFNKKDPILVGVVVLEGTVEVGTPICIPSKDFMAIGRISSIRLGQRTVDSATKGQEVAIKIVADNPEQQQRMYGRHFDHHDELVSFISRQSIDAFKAIYGDDNAEWKLLLKLSKLFNKRDRYIQ